MKKFVIEREIPPRRRTEPGAIAHNAAVESGSAPASTGIHGRSLTSLPTKRFVCTWQKMRTSSGIWELSGIPASEITEVGKTIDTTTGE